MDPRASPELQAEELANTIEREMRQANPDPQQIIDFMQLSHEVSMTLAGLGAMSHGRRIAVNNLIKRLQKLHQALTVLITALVQALMAPQPITTIQLPGGGASVFKP